MLIVLVVATAHAAVSPLPMIWNDTFIGRDRPGQVAADQRICRAQRRAYASLFRKASIPDKTIHIVALGGSMVVGIDTRCGKACAYPAYFARWLAARSAASVELENRAAGGMTSATALPVLGSLVRPLHGQKQGLRLGTKARPKNSPKAGGVLVRLQFHVLGRYGHSRGR